MRSPPPESTSCSSTSFVVRLRTANRDSLTRCVIGLQRVLSVSAQFTDEDGNAREGW
jgi:hypothetical protein